MTRSFGFAGTAKHHLFVIHCDDPPGTALDRFSCEFAAGAPLYGIDALPAARARRTLEGIAEDLVVAIERVQPDGPCYLAGQGRAGILAYEVALQLIGRGREIELIAMLADVHAAVAPDGLDSALQVYHPQIFALPLRRFEQRGEEDWAELPPESLGTGTAEGRSAEEELAAEIARTVPASRPGMRRQACMVELQRARQACLPLFCIPGAGASSICFMDFQAEIGDARTVYGFEPKGLDGFAVPHSTVEAAAAAYLGEMLPVLPAAGFHLLGHSYGGFVALELAAMLDRLGRAPATVTVLDAPEIMEGPAAEYDEAEILRKLLIVYAQRAGRPLGLDSRQLARLRGAALREALRAAMAGAGLLPPGAREDMLKGPLSVFARAARSNYRPTGRYRGGLRFALVDDPALDSAANFQAKLRRIHSWRRAAATVDFWEGPGDHMSVLRLPHVRTLAQWWAAGVRAADLAA